MKTLRIFISSPGDVQEERIIAGRVIERLQGKYWSFVRLDDVFWEYQAVRATAHYQDELINPGDCDLVLGILWSRLGRALPDRFRNARDEAMTGTEWELEEAFAAYERRMAADGKDVARPDVMVYRRRQPRPRHDDPEMELAADRDERQLESYLQREYRFPNGTIKRPVLGYRDLEEFEAKLFAHLEQLILKRLPKLNAGYEPPPISGSPFKNLTHFDFADADRFFGRNRAIREVQAKLLDQVKMRHAAFVLIYGASGYGKSSLMRAGLAPNVTRPGALVSHPWRRVLLCPQGNAHGLLCEQLARVLFTPPTGDDLANSKSLDHWPLPGLPELGLAIQAAGAGSGDSSAHGWDVGGFACALANEDQLAHATAAVVGTLKHLDHHLLIQIDQLEHVFTDDSITSEDREAFFRALSALSRGGRVWVVATMRSEFFPRIATCPPLHQLIQQGGGYILQPPNDQELREIIRYPTYAARLGFERLITPRLIGDVLSSAESLDDQILQDAKGSQDALPLLEFTLHQLYAAIAPEQADQTRNGDTLLWDTYAEIGGLNGAISTVADHAFRSLHPDAQQVRDKIFGNLVQVDAGNSDSVTRLRTPLDALIHAAPGAGDFISAFRSNNLLVADEDPVTGQSVITLTHEALLTHWPVLREWVRDHRGILRSRQRLREHCAQWQEAKKQSIKGKGKRPQDYLLTSGRLAEAEEVINCGDFTDLSGEEMSLVHHSRKASTRRIRMFQTAAVVFALLAIGAGALGWIANRQKLEANRLKSIAQQSEKQALTARNTAEGLINSMLFELRDKLAPLGKVELLDDVSRQAENYFRQNPSANSEAQRNEAVMWSERADVLRKSGDLQSARSAYERSLGIRQRLAESKPRDLVARLDLANSYWDLGLVAQAEGNLRSARSAYEKAVKIGKLLVAAYPRNAKAYQDLIVFHSRLGILDRIEGKLDGARENYEQSMKISKCWADGEPDNADAQEKLSNSYCDLGGICKTEGDLKAAIGAYEKALEISKRQAAVDPDNARRQWSLGLNCMQLGDVFKAANDLKTARGYFEKSLDIFKRLAMEDPSNVSFQLDWCDIHEKLGTIDQAEGDLKSARNAYVKSLDILRPIAEKDSHNSTVLMALGTRYTQLGVLDQSENDPESARVNFENSIVAFKRIANPASHNSQDFTVWKSLWVSYSFLGNIALTRSDYKAARAAWGESLEIIKRLAKENPRDAQTQVDLDTSYNTVGRIAEDEGELKSAREAYEKVVEIRKRLAKAEPRNAKAQRNLSLGYGKLGTTAQAEGNLDFAWDAYEKSVEVRKGLLRDDPDNAELQFEQSCVYNSLAGIAYIRKDFIAAQKANESALEINRMLAAKEPENPIYQGHLFNSYARIGSCAKATGDFKTAARWFEKCLELTESRAESEANKEKTLMERLESHVILAGIYDSDSNPAKTLSHKSSIQAVLTQMKAQGISLDPKLEQLQRAIDKELNGSKELRGTKPQDTRSEKMQR